MIRFVIFDLDDTLYPEIEFVKSGFRAVAPVLARWIGIAKEDIQQALWQQFEKSRKNVFDEILLRYNYWSSERIGFLLTVYRSHLPNINLYPDAKEIIKWLHSKNYRMGILTDGYFFVQRQKVRALRLVAYFDEIVYTDVFGRDFWKPDPRPFKFILDKAQCLAKQAIYIGDNPLKDFLGAKTVGMQTVQIKREMGIYSNENPLPGNEPDFVIKSLIEIKSLL